MGKKALLHYKPEVFEELVRKTFQNDQAVRNNLPPYIVIASDDTKAIV